MSSDASALDVQVGGSHYKQFAIQPIEFCQLNGLTACETNVIKYVCRHRHKDGSKDIQKAIHYLQLLLELEYQIEPPEPHKPEAEAAIVEALRDLVGEQQPLKVDRPAYRRALAALEAIGARENT